MIGAVQQYHISSVSGRRLAFVVSHLKKYREDLILSFGNKIGLIVIPASDERIKQFGKFKAPGPYSEKMHPVRRNKPVNVYEYDVIVLDADRLPYIF